VERSLFTEPDAKSSAMPSAALITLCSFYNCLMCYF
jgi:hypothetical protein